MIRPKNDTLLAALRRAPTPYTPVWLMRQAGRYLPEYNATRERAGSFLTLAKTPELACEVTMQPLERFALDAAILFSDILTVPDAMGLGLEFVAGEGPRFARPLREESDVAALQVPDLERLRYVFDAVSLIRRTLDARVPLIGFAGSPWTLACYMVEGEGSTDFRTIKSMLYRRPDLVQRVLEINAATTAAYLNAQIEAGAQAVMVFDTWGGVLSDRAYREFSAASMKRVISQLTRNVDGESVPVIVFTKGGGQWLDEMAGLGADAVGLDWTSDLCRAREAIGARCALQGNLDPMILFADEPAIRREVRRVIDSYAESGGNHTGHVFNLGHGISQFTPPHAVEILVDEVHAHSAKSRRM